ncbi:hypothetical protein K474DRAFT_1683413 [Panus rudis PR-1116 ss-1]|nr:hypothetical protein K474DRAFT_1683413 [Panus rudis PR-1116 ss-1]
MWVDKRVGGKERIYVLYDVADRQSAKLNNQQHVASESFVYDDFWSWDIHGKTWRRERLTGNVPSPRSESAYTFNEQVGLAVVYGGFTGSLPTVHTEPRPQLHPFTYYADTFVYVPHSIPGSPTSGPRWKQVITRGFPTYRAQSQFITDTATGKMYLFGGYADARIIPDTGRKKTMPFGDLWELKLDVPGGHFEGVDFDLEKRTAIAGPWKRCFNCGDVGPWMKCGGTCRGKVFFCEHGCLVGGWRLHKEMHGCAKE